MAALRAPSVATRQLLVGCDFSSSPSRKKPIVMATGWLHSANQCVVLERLERLESLDAFTFWLSDLQKGSWVGAFDFPFGLPRELVVQLGWPQSWPALIAHYAGLERSQIRALFAAFCNARPVGGKFAHRATDGLAGSSPSMKWVNPPVAFMLHAGVPRLLQAGVTLAGLYAPPDDGSGLLRLALEGYPGLLAKEILGRTPYKSDNRAKQTPEKLLARKDLITLLEQGATRLALRLKTTHALRDTLVADASGDSLDAALCLVQAGWGARLAPPLYGLPNDMDALEGWIVSA